MSIDTYSGLPEKDLRSKLAELHQENFTAGFTSEKMSPQKGAQMRERKKEIARILTVLAGRAALARHEGEQKKLELRLSGMGKPHQGSREDKRRRAVVSRRLDSTRRAVRELATVTPGAAKPAKGKKK
jgi:ribosomal protein L29